MCLIAYVPKYAQIDRATFDYAGHVNQDGIGVMSLEGPQYFFGRKKLKRARKYSFGLSARGVPHAVHWRWTTHGATCRELLHPFPLPNGRGYLMHNGVISQFAKLATLTDSDTSLFVKSLTDAPETSDNLDYWTHKHAEVGASNKLCVLYDDGTFVLSDPSAWHDADDGSGIKYSNLYSLPGYSWYDTKGVSGSVSDYAEKWWYRDLIGDTDADDKAEDTDPNGKPFGYVYDWRTGRMSSRPIADASDRWADHWRDRAEREWPTGKQVFPGGPTLDADKEAMDAACMLPFDKGGYG